MIFECGTDFSEDAKAGATVAAMLAGRLRDRSLLVHALPGGDLSASSPEAMSSLFANLGGAERANSGNRNPNLAWKPDSVCRPGSQT